MKQQVYTVENMTCAACSARIEKILSRKNGVNSAAVNLASEKLTVQFDEDTITSQQIMDAVAQIGYPLKELEQDKQVTLGISGMTCAACSARIEKVLAKQPGISRITVNLATEQAAIAYDPGQIRLHDIKEKIHALGYEPREVEKKSAA